MTERRPLTEGLKSSSVGVVADPQREREFVHGTKAVAPATPMKVPSPRRVAISTRIRSELAAALKRASLERQLNAVEPNTLQDILEQAIEPWLKSNGYIP